MLFNSFLFIVVFLPFSAGVFFTLSRYSCSLAKASLAFLSVGFYAWWDISFLPVLLSSILVNFYTGKLITRYRHYSKFTLTTGLCFNLGLLLYFKYTNFILANFSQLTSTPIPIKDIVLPLGISFITFQKIAYLIDCYREHKNDYSLIDYILFVTFFPQLISGPITHHHQIIPQFRSNSFYSFNSDNVLQGLILFSLGLAKKVLIADTLSRFASPGFDGGQVLTIYEGWLTALYYTLQLYFDFSGYCDMALGAALIFNIKLPLNFNSPYQALSIQDFWRRWHITLGQFLRDYVYIPLGGNRDGARSTSRNLLATFVLGGIWHGASWMFVIWGALHGLGMVIQHLWMTLRRPLPRVFSWLLTFGFVIHAWVFFRANQLSDAIRILQAMYGHGAIAPMAAEQIPPEQLAWGGIFLDLVTPIVPAGILPHMPGVTLVTLCLLLLPLPNAYQQSLRIRRAGTVPLVAYALLFALACTVTFGGASTVFLYFNF